MKTELPKNPKDNQLVKITESLGLRYLEQHPDNYFKGKYFPWIAENRFDNLIVVKCKTDFVADAFIVFVQLELNKKIQSSKDIFYLFRNWLIFSGKYKERKLK